MELREIEPSSIRRITIERMQFPVLHSAQYTIQIEIDPTTICAVLRELSPLLSAKTQNDTLSFKDISSGTFTITNLGSSGVTHFTPILNLPEVWFLEVGKKVATWVI